jgi:DNA topoisomerase-1
MGSSDRKVIKDLNRCDFREIRDHYADLAAKKKELCREEKQRLKDAKEKVMAEYSYCRVDGREEKIGNVQVEPPGLFLGRGEHPRMGCIKSRIQPEDVIVNCSGGSKSKIPKAPSGHRWKQVRHDSTVSWLASWTDSITV